MKIKQGKMKEALISVTKHEEVFKVQYIEPSSLAYSAFVANSYTMNQFLSKYPGYSFSKKYIQEFTLVEGKVHQRLV